MKKPIPSGTGLALAESLYSDNETASNIATPSDKYNLHGRPSLIPKVNYPITEEEERLLDLAWEHARNLSDRGLL